MVNGLFIKRLLKFHESNHIKEAIHKFWIRTISYLRCHIVDFR